MILREHFILNNFTPGYSLGSSVLAGYPLTAMHYMIISGYSVQVVPELSLSIFCQYQVILL